MKKRNRRAVLLAAVTVLAMLMQGGCAFRQATEAPGFSPVENHFSAPRGALSQPGSDPNEEFQYYLSSSLLISAIEQQNAVEYYNEAGSVIQNTKQYATWLNNYRSGELTEENQRAFAALEDYFNRALALADDCYFENPFLGSYGKIQHSIPASLQSAALQRPADLDGYFYQLADLKDTFAYYIEFEQKRQEEGLGLSQEILELAQGQAQAVADSGGKDVLLAVNEKIQAAAFLTDEKRAEAIAKNKTYIETYYVPAYQYLADELGKLEGPSLTHGLYSRPNGVQHYENLIESKLGIRPGTESMIQQMEEWKSACRAEIDQLLLEHPEFAGWDPANFPYFTLKNPEETLQYLETHLTDYPALEPVPYRVITIDPSQQEGFAPAAYFPQSTLQKGTEHIIAVNPSAGSSFATFAHEGFPGHLYQAAYADTLELPIVLRELDCLGYTEGWAIYVEERSHELLTSEIEREFVRYLNLNNRYSRLTLAYADIMIHTGGWDYQKFLAYAQQEFGLTDEAQARDTYRVIIEDPAYYLHYEYAGCFMDSLRKKAERELGEAFDPVAFHRAVLQDGSVGLSIVEKNVENYIDSHR